MKAEGTELDKEVFMVQLLVSQTIGRDYTPMLRALPAMREKRRLASNQNLRIRNQHD